MIQEETRLLYNSMQNGSLEFVFYQSGVLVELKGKKQSRRIHFLVQNAFQIVDSSAVVS